MATVPSSRSKPIKVLHVAESWGAGVATAVLTYVRNAPEQEHHLLYGNRRETSALAAGWCSGFATVRSMPEGHLRRIGSARATAAELDVDVVHAHSSFGGAYIRLGLRSSKRRRIVYTPHAYAFERGDVPELQRKLLYSLEWLLALNTDTFAACSPREQRLSTWKHSGSRVVYLPNVVDTAGMASATTGVQTGTEGVLSVAGSGRAGEQKDPAFFIRCVQSLRAHGHGVAGTWIGGGDTVAEERLRSAGIEVTGWLDRFTATRLMAQQDLYLHTARWEGFPLAVLEASALGVATVVRERPHFHGLELPATITAPEDLVAQWERFSNPGARRELVALTRETLAGNSPAAQARALRELYDPACCSMDEIEAIEEEGSNAR